MQYKGTAKIKERIQIAIALSCLSIFLFSRWLSIHSFPLLGLALLSVSISWGTRMVTLTGLCGGPTMQWVQSTPSRAWQNFRTLCELLWMTEQRENIVRIVALTNLCLGQELIPISPNAWCCAQRDAANRVLNTNAGDQCHYCAWVCWWKWWCDSLEKAETMRHWDKESVEVRCRSSTLENSIMSSVSVWLGCHRAAGVWSACCVVSAWVASRNWRQSWKKSVEKWHIHKIGRSDLFSKGCDLKSKLLLRQRLGTYLISYQSDSQRQNIWVLSAMPGQGNMSLYTAFKGRRGSCMVSTVSGCIQMSLACHGRAPAPQRGWANLQLRSMGASTAA